MTRDELDVAVIGAGVCGLFIALKLGRLGFRVGLFEQASTLAPAASSRNEGWLHAGTYHASAIADRERAVDVARKCEHGFRQIRDLAPEAVEWSQSRSVALVSDPERLAEAWERWRMAGVKFEVARLVSLRQELPSVQFDRACGAFYVQDVGIDVRILYRRLLVDVRRAGVNVVLNSPLRLTEAGEVERVDGDSGKATPVNASRVVLATGTATHTLVRSVGHELPFRMWKSHILFGPTIVDRPLFWVDPLEAAVVNHRPGLSVVGMTNDAQRVVNADYVVDRARAELVEDALRRTVRDVDLSAFHAYACIKYDLQPAGSPLSVEADLRKVNEKTYVVLSGKLTEAPFVADRIVGEICEGVPDPTVPLRPWD